MAKRTATSDQLPKDRLLPRLAVHLFGLPKLTILLWLVLVVFGALSYTVLLRREGFPSINIPIAIVQGTYIVNDPSQVDQRVAKPITDLALRQSGVNTVRTTSSANFYSIVVQYQQSANARQATAQLEQAVHRQLKLPPGATAAFNVPYFGVTGGDTQKIDDLISLYKLQGSATTAQLAGKAQQAVDYLNAHKPPLVKTFFVRDPFKTATDPRTGRQVTVQQSFDRFGQRQDGTNRFYNSVAIGVTGVNNVDVIKLDAQLKPLLAQLTAQPTFHGYAATISASSAPSINQEISELQRVLLEGLIAVLVVGSIVIAVRASIITVLSMITVILTTLGLLYLIGYTLNVITLFALILGLSLVVDDTIIMTEAIEASRRHETTAKAAIALATRKIARAMVAATLTAVLSFAPLLFVSGILGGFIRQIPVTLIAALLISLLVALIFIPLFARFLLLTKGQLARTRRKASRAAGLEAGIARLICRPMLWARGSTPKLFTVGIIAVIISLLFVGAAGAIFKKVTFNIFPPTKDTNALSVTLDFPPGTTIPKAEDIAAQADKLVAKTLGPNFQSASYYGTGSDTQAMIEINIIPYQQRSVTSQQLVKQLQSRFDRDFTAANAQVGQVDVGPPTSGFTVQIHTEDRAKGYRLAADVADYLRHTTLTRLSGTTAGFKNVTVSSPNQVVRKDGVLTIDVTANFTADDTSTLVTLAQNAVKQHYSARKLASFGLPQNTISFDIGQESDNQNSFKSLALAFPLLLLVIYILLAVEFRSLLQPLLIFMAIPFSLFGVTLGLYLTDNAFSFFTMMGFFALIGLSLKNTILLTDYANQSRRRGLGAIDSAVEALGERFRPLIATSLTAVVSLIPLAVTSPFWQGLAIVLIGGLLASTTLVILVFPYYYLGGEYLRTHFSRRGAIAWLVATLVLVIIAAKLEARLVWLAVAISLLGALVWHRLRRHR
ncbi:MAG TPA: efflux RND transporter permease subunit [Candidatus Saccharimonadales bacterium]|nr:efflux RND transporter permease subunit [Candidatus Saccharimonadales bacterium]